ncbi:hypothetical protein BGZ83_005316 [Gryganskiella cystojenkinii]|nr:hypothetical protein BGZ83_005316 [Gryganskiella cystojenkinii]
MKIHPLIAIISLISLAFAQDCDVVDEDAKRWTSVRQNVMPALGLLMSFPAGFGPIASLCVSSFMFFLDKVIPDPSKNQPDPLVELAIELSNKMDQKLDARTIDLFNQYAGGSRKSLANYRNAYDIWVKNGTPAVEREAYSLRSYYITQMGLMEKELDYMANSNYTYLALPQFVVMASGHLSILRDAAMIGNDYLNITNTQGSKTDFRQQFKEYLKKYTNVLASNYNAHLPDLFQKQHGNSYGVWESSEFRKTKKSQDLFNTYVAFETTTVLTAFDVAARWTMLLPPDKRTSFEDMSQENIPIDVVYTRPIYSEITKCDSYDDGFDDRSNLPNSYCNVNVDRLRIFKDIGIPYKGLLKKIKSAQSMKKGPLGFTRFWFEYEDGSTYGTPGDIDNDQDVKGYADFAYSDPDSPPRVYKEIDTLSTTNITYAKINPDFSCSDKSCYVFTGLTFGNTPITLPPKCAQTNEKLDIPDGHIFAGMFPMQNNRPREAFRWEVVFSMEYRKKNRVDFAGVTSPRALRFPADYIKFQEKMTTGDYDQMSYLLGGRSVKFPANVVFRLPPRNPRFDYNLRVYAKGKDASMTVNGCVLARRDVQFDGFDFYEGNCQQQKVILPQTITISGPLHLGAVEVVQVKAKSEFFERCSKDKDCKDDLKCMLNNKSNVSRCLKFPHKDMKNCHPGSFGVKRPCSQAHGDGSGQSNAIDPKQCANGVAFVQFFPRGTCSLSCDNATNCVRGK